MEYCNRSCIKIARMQSPQITQLSPSPKWRLQFFNLTSKSRPGSAESDSAEQSQFQQNQVRLEWKESLNRQYRKTPLRSRQGLADLSPERIDLSDNARKIAQGNRHESLAEGRSLSSLENY